MISLKDFFSFKNNRSFWLNIIGMIAVIIIVIFGALLWLDYYTHHGEAVVVPDVKGKLLNEAEFNITRQKLKVIVVDSTFVKGVKPNTVLDQNPLGGMKVKEGRMIYLTICSDKEPMIAVPDIVDNSSYRQAEARLKALGFKLTKPEMIAGERDWVYGLKYNNRNLNAGEKIPSESLLTLQIGSGLDNVPNDSLSAESVSGDKKSNSVADDSWF